MGLLAPGGALFDILNSSELQSDASPAVQRPPVQISQSSLCLELRGRDLGSGPSAMFLGLV